MPIDIAVVPVAGRGTRLLPLTKSQPKEMLPVGRKPVVQYVVEELADCGIRRLLFITGPGKTAIENHFDIDAELIRSLRETGKEELLVELEFERRKIEFFYTRQRCQLGLGHAVLCAKPFVGDQSFVLALGDSLLGLTSQSQAVSRMVEQFESQDADAIIAFEEVHPEEVIHYGIAAPRGRAGDLFALEDLVEKPSVNEAPSNLAVAARYVCAGGVFDLLEKTPPGKGGEIQLTDALRQLIHNGGKVLGYRLSQADRRFDIGNFESYFRALAESMLSDPQFGPAARKHVRTLLDQNRTPE